MSIFGRKKKSKQVVFTPEAALAAGTLIKQAALEGERLEAEVKRLTAELADRDRQIAELAEKLRIARIECLGYRDAMGLDQDRRMAKDPKGAN